MFIIIFCIYLHLFACLCLKNHFFVITLLSNRIIKEEEYEQNKHIPIDYVC